jgi:DNA-binding MarR family transcriptional regulator
VSGGANVTESDVASIERSLLALRRRQRRNALAGQRPSVDVRAVEVTDAIDSQSDFVTVADVAMALGIDPSQASRRVAAAVDAGFVCRRAAQQDGRISLLQLTDKGNRVVNEVRSRRRDLVAGATSHWTQSDLTGLADLLARLVDDLAQPNS